MASTLPSNQHYIIKERRCCDLNLMCNAMNICSCFPCSLVQKQLIFYLYPWILTRQCYFYQTDIHHIEYPGVLLQTMIRLMIKIMDISANISIAWYLIKIQRNEVAQIKSKYWIESEMILYSIANDNLFVTMNIVPKCYLANFFSSDRIPIIIVEDIIMNGYKQVEGKLDEKHLKVCLKALAFFHASGLRLLASDRPKHVTLDARLCQLITDDGINHYIISDFMRDDIWNSLEDKLTLYKIRKMLSDLSIWTPMDCFKTIIHGELTTSKLWFKYDNGEPCDMRILDWHGAKFGSPAIDFSYILLNNLPNQEESIREFCDEILHYYLDSLTEAYPCINFSYLEQHFLKRQIFTCVELYINHHDVTYDYLNILKIFYRENQMFSEVNSEAI